METPAIIPRRSLRFYLLLVCALTALPSALVLWLLASRHLDWTSEHSFDKVKMAASLAAARQENATGRIIGLFDALSEMEPVRRADPVICGEILSRIARNNPEFANLALFTPEGEVVASALPLRAGDLARQEFLNHALLTGEFSSGKAILPDSGQESLLPFAKPVPDRSGKVSGVLVGMVKPLWLNPRAAGNPDLDDIRIVFLDQDRLALAGYWRAGKEPVFKPLGPAVLGSFAPEPGKTAWRGPGPDGASWLFSVQDLFLSTGKQPYIRTLAGMPESAAIANLYRDFLWDFSILFSVAVVSLLLAYKVGEAVIVRRLERLTDAAGRIAGGDFLARSGMKAAPHEVARLGEAFDRMAAALEKWDSDRRTIVKSLRTSRKRFKDVASSVTDWIWEIDREGRFTYVSGRVKDVLGYTPAEMRGTLFVDLLIPGEKERVWALFKQSLDLPRIRETLEIWQKTKQGVRVCLQSTSLPMLDSSGTVTGFRGVCVDVTDQKLAEQGLLKSLSEKEVLLKEVHHRVKNNLQIITSLMNLQCQAFEYLPQVEEAFAQMRGRVRSIALIHERLYSTGDFSAVEMNGYVRNLAESVRLAQETPGRQVSLRYEFVSLTLPLDQALPLSLIVNEALTNCFKHGLAGTSEGEVLVSLTRTDAGVSLTVRDNGPGLPPEVLGGERQGLGFQLIEALSGQLRGSMELSNAPGGGACVTVSFS